VVLEEPRRRRRRRRIYAQEASVLPERVFFVILCSATSTPSQVTCPL
jgi:hypothetical protein